MPEITDSLELKITDGRHPVLDRKLVGESFVPNDVNLDGINDKIMVITGPNMAGKSTYIRQIAPRPYGTDGEFYSRKRSCNWNCG